MRRAHGRVGGGDDGHPMVSIGCMNLWIPHLHVQVVVLDLLQVDGPRPFPDLVHGKEPGDDGRGGGVRVQLADARRQQGTGNPPKVAHRIGVETASFGPQLDAAQGGVKGLDVRDQAEDLVRRPRPVQGQDALFVQVPEQFMV